VKKNHERKVRTHAVFSSRWHFGIGFLMISLFMTGLPASAGATADDPVHAENNALWISAGGAYLDYREAEDTGFQLDTERGWLPVVSAGASFMSSSQTSYLNNIYLALEGRATFGDVNYHGYLQNGTPYHGTTDEEIFSLDGRIGRGFALNNSFMLTPFAEFGFRYWDRNLGSYTEDYSNFDILGGLMGQYAPTSRLVLSLSAAGGTTFAPTMTSTNPTMNFNLGCLPMWKVGGKVGYALTQRLEALFSVDYDQFKFGKSQPVTNISKYYYYYEPNSQTGEFATQIGLAYHF
jgi:hypothetical protein